jgi:hypothetical protein
MRPVTEEEAMKQDMNNFSIDSINPYDLIRNAYKLTENISDETIKTTLQLRLRECAVYEMRIHGKFKDYTTEVYNDLVIIDEKEIAEQDMMFTYDGKYTYCEVIRDAYKESLNIKDNDELKLAIQLILRKAAITGTRMVVKLKEYRNTTNIDACVDPYFQGVSWVSK